MDPALFSVDQVECLSGLPGQTKIGCHTAIKSAPNTTPMAHTTGMPKVGQGNGAHPRCGPMVIDASGGREMGGDVLEKSNHKVLSRETARSGSMIPTETSGKHTSMYHAAISCNALMRCAADGE